MRDQRGRLASWETQPSEPQPARAAVPALLRLLPAQSCTPPADSSERLGTGVWRRPSHAGPRRTTHAPTITIRQFAPYAYLRHPSSHPAAGRPWATRTADSTGVGMHQGLPPGLGGEVVDATEDC